MPPGPLWRPTAERLLEEARRALLEDVLPAAGEGQRYTLLMIANALAIAVRELRDGVAVAAEEQAALSGFLGESAQGADAAEMEKLLAAAIRTGRYDADAALHELLSRSIVRRLEIANPKALRRHGRS
ncbi:MAG: DUF6285 domain-containing protein [Kiloniellales bacterium]